MKVGFLVSDLSASQLAAELLVLSRRALEKNVHLDVMFFCEAIEKPCLPPPGAVMRITEAFNFDGAAVATNLSTARKLIRMPGPRRKYFLVWGLEWACLDSFDHETVRSVYGDQRLDILCRSQDHALAIESAWGRRATVVGPGCSQLLESICASG
jgi:hypothetical protein